ncbi:sulfotransferase [Salipiger sp. P9]|uniref:tetratricopeptide repeat-containing sulfotransferase family protein n=1 Tax=Salipiger pentaromativorans TaxID=2943193 RepID=UPI002158547A|nr:tetratricopeptide repeat-containing sulfotransferase family protein [Salipiger pentaromativorans]MCR8549379.1 sulfotransferase [Salipiger pentaromativorans]
MLPLSAATKARLFQQATAHMAQGRFAQAKAALTQLAAADPTRPEFVFHLSRIAFEEGDREACLANLRKAVALAPSHPKVTQHAAERFRYFGCAEEALAAYDRLIAEGSQVLKARADKAHYLQLLGRFDEAEKIFRKLIRQHPDEAQLYRIFLTTKTLRSGDPLLQAMERLWPRKDLSDERRIHLGYALGKALEETGQPARAFACFKRANALQRKAAPFDNAAQDREFAGVLAAQEGLDPGAPLRGAPLSPRPIFVTGMPRSGTTLVERILAAHSDVAAGNELGLALKLAYGMFGVGEDMRPLAAEPPEALRAFAERYSLLARRDVPGESPVITDKSILSYLIVGLLHHSLPGARFIVVQRDPRDIALSIYKNFFATGTHRYGNDLADIAHAIKRFRDMIGHWKTRLPGVIHEIRYEDLVADPEPQSRALVAAAGLDWQDACLDFHKNTDAVKTLSVSQVRQPIYRGSARAWAKYERELEPFIEAWGDEPWD